MARETTADPTLCALPDRLLVLHSPDEIRQVPLMPDAPTRALLVSEPIALPLRRQPIPSLQDSKTIPLSRGRVIGPYHIHGTDCIAAPVNHDGTSQVGRLHVTQDEAT
ncbi:MAG: hypothetical protein AAGE03_11270 [Pseudomonadota bacterium]